MKITKEQILHVANLARVEIDDTQVDTLSGQIADILDYVETLSGAETGGVSPTSHDVSTVNVFREDTPRPSLGQEAALANAPRQEDGHFVVPKSIG